MLGLFLLFALNYLFSALFSKKTALLLTNQNGEIFLCILLQPSSKNFKEKHKKANSWEKIGEKFNLTCLFINIFPYFL